MVSDRLELINELKNVVQSIESKHFGRHMFWTSDAVTMEAHVKHVKQR